MSSSSEEEEFVGDEESEEDMPLSKLKTNGKRTPANDRDEQEESQGEIDDDDDDDDNDDGDDDDDDDEGWDNEDEEGEDEEEEEEEEETPPSKRKRKSVSYQESDDDDDEDDEDDDDDVPLAALKTSPTKKAKNGTQKAAKPKKASSAKATKEPVKKKETTSKASDGYQSASAALYGSECQKGLLIQRLLCRWWYSITWPNPADLPKKPPAHYDSLDGFPGVYICTDGDEVGQILDVRDKKECPSFQNFARKSSEELQTLLLKALEEQKKQLIQTDGAGTPTEKELNELIKWTKKLKPSTADREAEKVLKAAKFSLS